MGIVANVKQIIGSVKNKAEGGMTKASSLTPQQIQAIEDKKADYLSRIPDMEGVEAQNAVNNGMGAIGIEVYQAYLERLAKEYAPVDIGIDKFDEHSRIRFFDITKWVTDSEEQSLDKLVNVYHTLSGEDCNIALIYHRTKDNCKVTMGVVNTSESESDASIANKYYKELTGAIKGNFPGAEINKGSEESNQGIPECLKKVAEIKNNEDGKGWSNSIAIVSNVASEKSEDFISQSMEKLLDGIVPKDKSEEYTIVLLAKPLKEQLNSMNRLYELYTALAPYASWQSNHTYTESDSTGSSATFGASLGGGIGYQQSASQSEIISKKQLPGEDPISFDELNGMIHKLQTKEEEFFNCVENTAISIENGESKIAETKEALFGIGKKLKETGIDIMEGAKKNVKKVVEKATTAGVRAMSRAGENAGVVALPTVTVAQTAVSGFTPSVNFGVNFSKTLNTSVQVGLNDGVTQTYTNFGVKHTLEIIEEQLKRIEKSSALGMWDFAAYIISESPVIVNNVAHMYLALTQGEESYIARAAANFWYGDKDVDASKTILSCVQKLQHPIFGLKGNIDDESLFMYPTLVTPTTPLSGEELAKALNFPRKSVSGLPVLEVVPFGREPHSLLEEKLNLDIGCGYHMRKRIPEQRISLSKEELTKHTFITGSTGSGKSNAVYRLLDRLGEEDVRFLVVEPAKGEYKDVLGKKQGVATYGTNPNIKNMSMLRINPFRFPEHTHILEHLDRLVEIFNVCWPMYAAMPAILKDSVERAYVKSGWNLEKSVNSYDKELFPTFSDVVKQIKEVLEESDYSKDNKGDYTGSLVTRLNSLTNGINGLIFTTDDISDEELFDKNVIVDLSRVGSSETKSLIMGLLVLKLQEHRMEQRYVGANANDILKHITVLEEAHNLLKRTSTEQTSEGANLIGKSVEMLANSIAEMRTYGEGFIIADQSPGLLDMSVIRNTNTKIILRLPDFSDRELVGKAAGLTDNQIIEISKLEKGVAAISQSDWLEPVLCKIDKYEGKGEPFGQQEDVTKTQGAVNSDLVRKSLLDCIMNKEIYRKGDRVDIQRLKAAILKSKLDATVKCDFIEYIKAEKQDAVKALRSLAYDFFQADKAMESSRGFRSPKEWTEAVIDALNPSIKGYSRQQINLVLALIMYEQEIRNPEFISLFNRQTEIYKRDRRFF